MRALSQRVIRASVSVDDHEIGAIGPGMLVLLGVAVDDQEADAQYLVEKLVNLRIFAGHDGRFDLSAMDVGAELLLVSQFTLYADTRKGRLPVLPKPQPQKTHGDYTNTQRNAFARLG